MSTRTPQKIYNSESGTLYLIFTEQDIWPVQVGITDQTLRDIDYHKINRTVRQP